jgi:hypothetical protein
VCRTFLFAANEIGYPPNRRTNFNITISTPPVLNIPFFGNQVRRVQQYFERKENDAHMEYNPAFYSILHTIGFGP